MDVPVEHFGMPTFPRATQRDVATLALRQGATCHSLQRREAEARVATNRTSASCHMTLGAQVARLKPASRPLAVRQLATQPWGWTTRRTRTVRYNSKYGR
jgi:hypothetical protein